MGLGLGSGLGLGIGIGIGVRLGVASTWTSASCNLRVCASHARCEAGVVSAWKAWVRLGLGLGLG